MLCVGKGMRNEHFHTLLTGAEKFFVFFPERKKRNEAKKQSFKILHTLRHQFHFLTTTKKKDAHEQGPGGGGQSGEQ